MAVTITTSSLPHQDPRYLFGPLPDFVLLGGGSLVALVALIWLTKVDMIQSLSITMAAANFINHPHFAHSYQIFYGGLITGLRSSHPKVAQRYVVAGLIVPLALFAFLAYCISSKSPQAFSIAVNLMVFSVGWHYAKQGYGMIILDSVLKRAYFTSLEKQKLLRNAYVIWILSWLLVSSSLADKTHLFFGIPYYGVDVPSAFLYLLLIAATLTSVDVLRLFTRRIVSKAPLPLSGSFAYLASLYPWLLWRDPVMLLWFPMLHSLQYLVVVARFQINRELDKNSAIRPSLRIGLFYAVGALLGYAGFWGLPRLLQDIYSSKAHLANGEVFLFSFWIFINVHHYFLDSAMWHRDNADVSKYLFS